MATVDLTPQKAVASIDSWIDPTGALYADNFYTQSVSGSSGFLKLSDFTAGLPKDITISGIQIFFNTKLASASTGTYLNAAFSYDGMNVVSNTLTTSSLNQTLTLRALGSSTELWGLPEIRRPKISPNKDFTVLLWRTGDDVSVWIEYVTVRIHYTVNSYLRGERSEFPYSFDNPQHKQNGVSPANRIKADDVNLLGDCLYTIQSYVLNGGQDKVKAIGYPPGVGMALFSVTVTGTVTSSGMVYFNVGRQAGWSTTLKYTNLNSTQGSQPPLIDGKCEFVSAFGWVQCSSGLLPIHVTPRAFYVRKLPASRTPDDYDVSYSFGFIAVPQSIYATLQAQTNQNYKGAHLTPGAIPVGTVVIKMMAIGLIQ